MLKSRTFASKVDSYIAAKDHKSIANILNVMLYGGKYSIFDLKYLVETCEDLDNPDIRSSIINNPLFSLYCKIYDKDTYVDPRAINSLFFKNELQNIMTLLINAKTTNKFTDFSIVSTIKDIILVTDKNLIDDIVSQMTSKITDGEIKTKYEESLKEHKISDAQAVFVPDYTDNTRVRELNIMIEDSEYAAITKLMDSIINSEVYTLKRMQKTIDTLLDTNDIAIRAIVLRHPLYSLYCKLFKTDRYIDQRSIQSSFFINNIDNICGMVLNVNTTKHYTEFDKPLFHIRDMTLVSHPDMLRLFVTFLLHFTNTYLDDKQYDKFVEEYHKLHINKILSTN